jgi:hypothetical protein
MRTVALLAILALPLLAQEAPPPAATSTDPLAGLTARKPAPDVVAVARAARAKKAASTSKPKVITNADLKKAKSTLKVHPIAEADATPPAANSRATPQKEDEHFRATKAATERVTVAEKKVTDLKRELDLAEQNYYNENDPTYRDDVVRKRFDQTKRQLDAARKELADARDALTALK